MKPLLLAALLVLDLMGNAVAQEYWPPPDAPPVYVQPPPQNLTQPTIQPFGQGWVVTPPLQQPMAPQTQIIPFGNGWIVGPQLPPPPTMPWGQ